jgi:hypothetical protein
VSLLAPFAPIPTFADIAKLLGIPEKRRVFISYHHRGDQAFKAVLQKLYSTDYDLLEDRSLERLLDTDDLKYVEREIREDYIKGASVTIVLCGRETSQRKFVDWEIHATLLQKSALIGLQLPTPTHAFLPWRLFDNVVSRYAVLRTWREMVARPGILRFWIEEALQRQAARIDNARPKMRRNGEFRVHPHHP